MTLSLTPSNSLKLNVLDSVSLVGAEIAGFDSVSKKFFVTTPSGLVIVDSSDPTNLSVVNQIDFSSAPYSFSNDVNSVAVKNGVVAVAVANSTKTNAGKVFLLNSNGELLNTLEVGSLPDMLTFTPNGKALLVANEGERNAPNGEIDPNGSISIIDLSSGIASATVREAVFTAFNGSEARLIEQGARIYNNKTVSQEAEPEYIAVNPDGKTALVSLQEMNAVGILDIKNARITKIVPLGLKSFKSLLADFSDRDGPGGTNLYSPVTGYDVFGMYMPDAIAAFTSRGKTYYAIANEGDSRDDFIAGGEEVRLSALNLDAIKYPNSDFLKSSAVLGRLTVANPAAIGGKIAGDTDNDGDLDQIISYGARSFSILDAKGKIVFDSADHIERFIATQGIFSSGGAFDDGRSDNKGPEPEGLTVQQIGGRTFAFVGLERGGGGVMVYDVTDVKNVQFVTYAKNEADISPEGLSFIGASESPNGQALLAVANEVSKTLTVYGLTRIVNGDSKNNKIVSIAGVDEMTGGNGKDQFIFTKVEHIGKLSGQRDVITDFVSGTDIVNLKAIDANTNLRGDQSFVFSNRFDVGAAGRLVISHIDQDLLVSGDTNGDGLADFTIELQGVSAWVSSDFIL